MRCKARGKVYPWIAPNAALRSLNGTNLLNLSIKTASLVRKSYEVPRTRNVAKINVENNVRV